MGLGALHLALPYETALGSDEEEDEAVEHGSGR